MQLLEYQSKHYFAKYGILVPRGTLISRPEQARATAGKMGQAVYLKCQIPVDNLRAVGGVKLAYNADEAERYTRNLLGRKISGYTVNEILVEEAVKVKQALYLSLCLDKESHQLIMLCARRGYGPQKVRYALSQQTEALISLPIDIYTGPFDFQLRNLAFELGLQGSAVGAFTLLANDLFRVFVESDANLVEICPLALSENDYLIVIDAKMQIDPNALFRHPRMIELQEKMMTEPAQSLAYDAGINYLKLKGEVAVLANGTGLGMAIMDLIEAQGVCPASFLDIGSEPKLEKLVAGLRVILSDKNVKAILINLFGDIVPCEKIATDLLAALIQVRPSVPVVVRLAGPDEDQARNILNIADVETAVSIESAIKKTILSIQEAVPYGYSG